MRSPPPPFCVSVSIGVIPIQVLFRQSSSGDFMGIASLTVLKEEIPSSVSYKLSLLLPLYAPTIKTKQSKSL